MKKATKFEQEILDICLKELRRAIRAKGQLTVIIDPFVMGGGAHVFASPNTEGRSYEVLEKRELKKREKCKSRALVGPLSHIHGCPCGDCKPLSAQARGARRAKQ